MAPLLGAIVLVGCSTGTDQDDPPVARAYDQYLRWSDLRQVVPMDAAAEDSAAMAQAYIDNWLQQQVELHHAESNLAPSEKEFEAELRDYRNSLLMIAFEDALAKKKKAGLAPGSIAATRKTFLLQHTIRWLCRRGVSRERKTPVNPGLF